MVRLAKRRRLARGGRSAFMKNVKSLARRRRFSVRPVLTRGLYRQTHLPRIMKTPHTYYTQVAIDPEENVIATHIFSATSVYDPDVTGVGHKPLGTDQMFAIYDHYVVLGAKIAARCQASTSNASFLGIFLKDNDTPETSISKIMEHGTSKSKRTCDSQTTIVKKAVNPLKFLNRKRWDDEVKGSASASPAENLYFHVVLGSTVGGNPASVTIEVKIQYYVMWFEPKMLSQS